MIHGSTQLSEIDAVRRRLRSGQVAFTLLEIMLAIAIFGMAMVGVYSTWTAILRSARVGRDAAAAMQRARVTGHTLQDALTCAVMFEANMPLYTFEADTHSEFAALSFVSRLPRSFIGSGYFGDQVVRRVTFTVEQSADGGNELVLRQAPLLETNLTAQDAYTLVLARHVSEFKLKFYQTRFGWEDDWKYTNTLPEEVRFKLVFNDSKNHNKQAQTVVMRTVSIASMPVGAVLERQAGLALPPAAGMPGSP